MVLRLQENQNPGNHSVMKFALESDIILYANEVFGYTKRETTARWWFPAEKNVGLNWKVYDLTTGVFKLNMLMITIGLHSLILFSISLTFIQGHSTIMMFDYVRELTAKKLHKYPEYRSFEQFLFLFLSIYHIDRKTVMLFVQSS